MATGDDGDKRRNLVTWALPSSVDDSTANHYFVFLVAHFVLSAFPALYWFTGILPCKSVLLYR